jgi:hypothetical protein
MVKAFTAVVLGMMLCFVATDPAASEEPALTEERVRELFADNTEVGEGYKGEEDTGRRWKAFFSADGSVRKREEKGGKLTEGTWFVDQEGRHCFRWEHKDKTKCDFIVPEGDYYLRLRDGQVRGRIRIQEGNPANL